MGKVKRRELTKAGTILVATDKDICHLYLNTGEMVVVTGYFIGQTEAIVLRGAHAGRRIGILPRLSFEVYSQKKHGNI